MNGIATKPMKGTILGKILIGTALVGACAFAFTGCAQPAKEGYTGGVAATVNGVDIPEDKVTEEIQDMRATYGLDSDETWGSYLASIDSSPADIREQVLDGLISQELIKQGVKDAGLTVEPSEVDEYVDRTRSYYDSDKEWQDALEQTPYGTEENYREAIENSLYARALQTNLMDNYDPGDEAIINYATENADTYNDARRSSHILFAADDEATAQSVLDQLNAGEITFEDAVAQYSTDEGSKENGGDVGWDVLTTFVDEYENGLKALQPGQMSGLVQSQFGYHIILCTDAFTMPEAIESIDQFPAEILEDIKTKLSGNESQLLTDWLEGKRAEEGVVVNDMPSGLAYDIDMAPYTTIAEGDTTEAETEAEGLAEEQASD